MASKKTLITAAAFVLATQAQGAQARVTYICPELHGTELKVRVDSGCTSSSLRYEGNDLALEVDPETATISVSGDFTFSGGGRIVKTDCMGAKSITLSALEVDARRYTLLYEGQSIGIADLIEDARPKQCLAIGKATRRFHEPQVHRSKFADWATGRFEGWQDWRASSVISLIEPLLGDHPETLEGKPTVELAMEKRRWAPHVGMRNPISTDPFIAVEATRHGFLDDAVSGDRMFIAIVQGPDGWRISDLWHQSMCARGPKAGQWTGDTCP